ncbi:nuclear transport factor 2 family protein [Polaromonas sp. P1(28)-8]|nr:nuclear transport factor 2 family protein [Polaromonas sp. P1(28)-8]
MPAITEDTIRRFIVQQAVCWNSGRKDDFLALYRELTPEGLTVEYVGRSTMTGDAAWAALDAMWTGYAHQVRIQPVEIIVNGSDVACYYRNLWIEPGTLSSGIEVYTVQDGRIHVRIFH